MAEYNPTAELVVLTIAEVDDTENLLVCITQLNFAGSSNVTTVDTKCGTEQLPTTQTQTVNGTFRRVWNPDTGRTSEADLYGFWKNETHVQFTYAPVTPSVDGTPVYTGTGYFTSFGNNDDASAAPTSNFVISCDEPMDMQVFEAS